MCMLSPSPAVSLEKPEVPESSTPDSPLMSRFRKEYPAVFGGIGKLKGREAHLHLKDNAKPIVQKTPENTIPSS